MAYVMNLGRSGIELVGINKNVVHSYNRYDFRHPDDLKYEDDFKSILDELKSAHPDLKDEAVYLMLQAGCGIQYRVFTVMQDVLMVSGSATTKEEQAKELTNVCSQKVPGGLTGTFATAVFNDYLQENDYVVSCAFLYESMLNNIINAFTVAEINLFDIIPFSYAIYKSLDSDKFAQVIVDLPEEMLLVNNIGVIGWTKPAVYSKQLANTFLVSEAHRHYGIDNAVVSTSIVVSGSLGQYVYDSFVNKSGSEAACVYAAFGLVNGSGVKKEGGMKGAVCRLRQFFDKRKKEPSSV